MRKSKTILDFFGKSPAGNSKSPSNILKGSPKEKISVKVTGSKTPRSDRKTKDSTEENDTVSKENSTTPITDASTKTKRKIFSAEKDNGIVSSSPVSSNEECDTPKRAKRRRIVVESDSDDSADEYKPGKEDESDEDSMSEASAVSETETPEKKVKTANRIKHVPSFDVYNKDSPSNTPKLTNGSSPASFKISNGLESPNASFNSSFSNLASPRLSSQKSTDASNQNKDATADKIRYLHEKLDWLMPKNIKDKCGRRSSHPDYDPTTVYVPESFKKNLTPGMKQWWDIKADHFDTVLFFKVGKFYEFYHMDAAIGVKELDLSFMKGDFAHSGFPEVAFGKFSDILIHKGYKIARIEQTETPQMMEQRCKKMHQTTKYDKVVKREVCQVTSKGTRTTSYEEWCNNIGSSNNFLLAICEKHVEQEASATEYGICFVDTTIGKFTLGQFYDDRHKSRLLSFIGLYPPVEILFEKSSVSQKTLKLFENNLAGISMQALSSGSFWDGTKTLKFMTENGCCKVDGDDVQWPEVILEMLDKDDKLYQTPAKEYELGFKALGACIWYLKSCLIEDCLLTMKLFDVYKPIDGTANSQVASKKQCKYMILDNVTLHNLAIIPSQSSKSGETLYGTLNYCETSFGKRELRKWLCSPLFQSTEIYDRLHAIDDLKNIPIFDDARKILRKLPDLERLLNKIHIHGLARSKVHPASRAIFYEMEIYNKKKIADLLSALQGFKESVNICALFEPHIPDFNSNILKNCFSAMQDNGETSKIKEVLSFFSEAFDHEKAIKQGSIIPYPGVDDNYDSACKKIQDTLDELDSYREKQSRKLNCQAKFVKNGKNRYLLEVPENKNIPSEYEFQGGRKGYKRFYTKEIKELLSELTSFEEARDSALRDTTRHIFEQFDKHYAMWEKTVQCLSTLDVLLSLTNYCKITVGKMCKPEFLTEEDNSDPHLEIIEGRHPLFEKYCPNKDYIPNSIYIGKKNDSKNINKGGKVILVTGPNMGGKSTLMRQTGILLIMAQIGCYVPAESMVLTPVDRVFTRVGANDQIYKGESTFFVESNETASILQHATHRSFVLIDELGRGTATYDGTAIAYSTASYIANEIGCRTLFSTHYHSLVEDFRDDPNVGLGHMACMVEKDSDCSVLEKVTFLYKFVDGACPKSYGFNVALLAGIAKEIVHKGLLKSQQIDFGSRISKCLRKLLTVKSPKEIIGRNFSDILNT